MKNRIRLIIFIKTLFVFALINFLLVEKSFAQENCTNGKDDDLDGLIDCEDPDCECIECFATPQIITGVNSGNPVTWEVAQSIGVSQPPNSPLLNWDQPKILSSTCASTWANPQLLPSPLDQAKWITHENCPGLAGISYYFYKARFSLPCSCGGQPVANSTYTINIEAYIDNTLLKVYVNDQPKFIPVPPGNHFEFGDQIKIELDGPWLPLENTITFLIRNDENPNPSLNPQGLLAVLSHDADSDNDGVNDYLDLCLCEGHSIIDTTFISLTSDNPLDIGTVVSSFLTEYGCENVLVEKTSLLPTDSTFSVPEEDRLIYIPDAFSPNFDGINDHFTIFHKPNTLININYLWIFDRWGAMVFEKIDIEPSSPLLLWDGTHKGKELNPGYFTYMVEVEWGDGKTELFKGGVQLVK